MCECIKKMNESLASKNGKISTVFQINANSLAEKISISTEKLDKSKRMLPPKVLASYCPFCGEKLVSEALA
jgi:hypothetical protein